MGIPGPSWVEPIKGRKPARARLVFCASWMVGSTRNFASPSQVNSSSLRAELTHELQAVFPALDMAIVVRSAAAYSHFLYYTWLFDFLSAVVNKMPHCASAFSDTIVSRGSRSGTSLISANWAI